MSYKEKYLKYKFKYLQIKQHGSGFKTARVIFNKKLKNEYSTIYNIFNNDNFLKSQITNFLLPIPEDFNITKIEDEIFNKIFDVIKSCTNNNNIDLFCKIYLSNNLGAPNSIENSGRFTDNISKFDILQANKGNTIKKESFTSLTDLEDYIITKKEAFDCIEKKKLKQQKRSDKHIQIKTKGENRVCISLDIEDVKVYIPLDKDGAIYYGQGTKWCTASDNNNMFDHYREDGIIYIIIGKNGNKYQMHFESNQLMDSRDKPVTLEYVKNDLQSKEFNVWVNKIINDLKDEEDEIFNDWIDKTVNEYNTGKHVLNLDFEYNSQKFYDPNFSKLEELIDLQQLDELDKLSSLKTYDLSKLTNLKKLEFKYNFNEELSTSLSTLTNLTSLTFGYNFNQPLCTSLINLCNLKELTFGTTFNQSFGSSLSTVTNLTSLTFGDNYNQNLGTSLKYLYKLTTLTFGNDFNNPFDHSLSTFKKLTSLTFGNKFNQELDSSLLNNKNLKYLTLGNDFFQSLNFLNLSNLISLSGLNFIHSSYSGPEIKLSNLTNLKELIFGDKFNQKLDTSLLNFTNLEKLTFGYKFNQELDTSLSNLTNLKKLTFGHDFNKQLGTSLLQFDKLKYLDLGFSFMNEDQPLNTSLSALHNLEELFFGRNFNQKLDTSLSTNTNLKIYRHNMGPYMYRQ